MNEVNEVLNEVNEVLNEVLVLFFMFKRVAKNKKNNESLSRGSGRV